MTDELFLNKLEALVRDTPDRVLAANRAAESIAAAHRYRWVGLYEVTATEIAMIACTSSTIPAFPRFPISQGLCGSSVSLRAIVNVGIVQEDPRWLPTFGSTRSEIIVPVFSPQGPVVGLVDVESNLLNAFTTDDEQFLSRCAPFLLPLFS